jgi:hypothetical protein
LNEKERFVTLAHELGHIFCGHLGECQSRSGQENAETGWPDRRDLGKNEQEIEAEAVAYLVATRADLVTASVAYLRGLANGVDLGPVVIRDNGCAVVLILAICPMNGPFVASGDGSVGFERVQSVTVHEKASGRTDFGFRRECFFDS